MSDPQKQIKEWLADKLKPHGAITRASAATGMSKDQLGRSKELESDDPKKRRALKSHEIERLARHFNELPPGYEQMTNWLAPGDQASRLHQIKTDVDALTEAEKKDLIAYLLGLSVSSESPPQPGSTSHQEADE